MHRGGSRTEFSWGHRNFFHSIFFTRALHIYFIAYAKYGRLYFRDLSYVALNPCRFAVLFNELMFCVSRTYEYFYLV